MAGVPPLAGFVAKESVLEAFVHHAGEPDAGPWGMVVLAGLVLGSILTFAYSARFMWGAFAVEARRGAAPRSRPIRPSFLAAPAVLSLLTIVYGLWPAPVDGWIQPYAALFASTRPTPERRRAGRAPGAVARTYPGAGPDRRHLRARRCHVLRPQRRGPRCRALVPDWIDGDRGYQLTIGALDDVAVWVTGRTQRGSLYFYLSVILTVAFVLPLSGPARCEQAAAGRTCTSWIRTLRCSWWRESGS